MGICLDGKMSLSRKADRFPTAEIAVYKMHLFSV